MSCGTGDGEQMGCSGGSAFKAWEHTMAKGIVTGGNFGSNEVNYYYNKKIWSYYNVIRRDVKTLFVPEIVQGCQPYQRSTCDRFGDTGGRNCSSQSLTARTICTEKCSNDGYGIDYKDDLHKSEFLSLYFNIIFIVIIWVRI